MDALSAAAAISELLSLSIKVSKAAKNFSQGFLNAPSELVELQSKLDRLQSRIEQLRDLGKRLPVSDSALLLPPEHQTLITTSLTSSLEALKSIGSLCDSHTGKSETVVTRLRWAVLDKKKAERVLGKVAMMEGELNSMLAILELYEFLIVPVRALAYHPHSFRSIYCPAFQYH
jgi:hypothetical protein